MQQRMADLPADVEVSLAVLASLLIQTYVSVILGFDKDSEDSWGVIVRRLSSFRDFCGKWADSYTRSIERINTFLGGDSSRPLCFNLYEWVQQDPLVLKALESAQSAQAACDAADKADSDNVSRSQSNNHNPAWLFKTTTRKLIVAIVDGIWPPNDQDEIIASLSDIVGIILEPWLSDEVLSFCYTQLRHSDTLDTAHEGYKTFTKIQAASNIPAILQDFVKKTAPFSERMPKIGQQLKHLQSGRKLTVTLRSLISKDYRISTFCATPHLETHAELTWHMVLTDYRNVLRVFWQRANSGTVTDLHSAEGGVLQSAIKIISVLTSSPTAKSVEAVVGQVVVEKALSFPHFSDALMSSVANMQQEAESGDIGLHSASTLTSLSPQALLHVRLLRECAAKFFLDQFLQENSGARPLAEQNGDKDRLVFMHEVEGFRVNLPKLANYVHQVLRPDPAFADVSHPATGIIDALLCSQNAAHRHRSKNDDEMLFFDQKLTVASAAFKEPLTRGPFILAKAHGGLWSIGLSWEAIIGQHARVLAEAAHVPDRNAIGVDRRKQRSEQLRIGTRAHSAADDLHQQSRRGASQQAYLPLTETEFRAKMIESLRVQKEVLKKEMILAAEEVVPHTPASMLKAQVSRDATLRYMTAKHISNLILKMIHHGDENGTTSQSGSSVSIRFQDVLYAKVSLPVLALAVKSMVEDLPLFRNIAKPCFGLTQVLLGCNPGQNVDELFGEASANDPVDERRGPFLVQEQAKGFRLVSLNPYVIWKSQPIGNKADKYGEKYGEKYGGETSSPTKNSGTFSSIKLPSMSDGQYLKDDASTQNPFSSVKIATAAADPSSQQYSDARAHMLSGSQSSIWQLITQILPLPQLPLKPAGTAFRKEQCDDSASLTPLDIETSSTLSAEKRRDALVLHLVAKALLMELAPPSDHVAAVNMSTLGTQQPLLTKMSLRVNDWLKPGGEYANYSSVAGPAPCKGFGHLLLNHCIDPRMYRRQGDHTSSRLHHQQYRLFIVSKSSKNAACLGLNAELIWQCGSWSPTSFVKIWQNIACTEDALNLSAPLLKKGPITVGLHLSPELEDRLQNLPSVSYEDLVTAISNGVAIDMAHMREDDDGGGFNDDALTSQQYDHQVRHDGLDHDANNGFVVIERRNHLAGRYNDRQGRELQLYKLLADLTLEGLKKTQCFKAASDPTQHVEPRVVATWAPALLKSASILSKKANARIPTPTLEALCNTLTKALNACMKRGISPVMKLHTSANIKRVSFDSERVWRYLPKAAKKVDDVVLTSSLRNDASDVAIGKKLPMAYSWPDHGDQHHPPQHEQPRALNATTAQTFKYDEHGNFYFPTPVHPAYEQLISKEGSEQFPVMDGLPSQGHGLPSQFPVMDGLPSQGHGLPSQPSYPSPQALSQGHAALCPTEVGYQYHPTQSPGLLSRMVHQELSPASDQLPPMGFDEGLPKEWDSPTHVLRAKLMLLRAVDSVWKIPVPGSEERCDLTAFMCNLVARSAVETGCEYHIQMFKADGSDGRHVKCEDGAFMAMLDQAGRAALEAWRDRCLKDVAISTAHQGNSSSAAASMTALASLHEVLAGGPKSVGALVREWQESQLATQGGLPLLQVTEVSNQDASGAGSQGDLLSVVQLDPGPFLELASSLEFADELTQGLLGF